ncbi:enoyl-CoA hydratase/isomerase [Hyaloraphidium curvatum]|nr:enoyl-CoA hydratase/isomerase [Hyaloraphidium curvatum]
MAQYGPYNTIRVSVEDGHVAVVTLSRPKNMNAFTWEMSREVVDAYTKLERDDRVKVIVMTGDPAGKAFCGGADLSQGGFEMGSGTGDAEGLEEDRIRDLGGTMTMTIYRCKKVTIAAFNGAAVGIGMSMTMPQDFRITAADNKHGFVFVRRGVVPECGCTFFLPRLIGHSKALGLLLTGRVYLAKEPPMNELFYQILPKASDVLPAAMELAREIATHASTVSAALVKSMVWHGYPTPEETWLLDSKLMYITGRGNDSKEGVKSFFEKRPPNFTSSINDIENFGGKRNFPWWDESVDIKPEFNAPNFKLGRVGADGRVRPWTKEEIEGKSKL